MKQVKGKFQGAHANPKLAENLCAALNGQPIIPVYSWLKIDALGCTYIAL